MTNGDGISLESFLSAGPETQIRMMFEMQLKTHQEVLELKKQFSEQPTLCQREFSVQFAPRKQFNWLVSLTFVVLSYVLGARLL